MNGYGIGQVDRIRPWSIMNRTFQSNFDFPECETLSESLESIRLGTRYGQPEDGTSHFISKSCRLRYYPADDACKAMSRFSHVYFVGDSITRGVSNGLRTLLLGDFVYGAIPQQMVKAHLYEKCICDGQFSEHDLCRGEDDVHQFDDPRSMHACYDSPPFRFQYVFHSKPPKINWLCGSDPRPRFIQYQIGAHVGVQADSANKLFENFLVQLEEVRTKCPFQAVIFFTGMNAQDSALDVRFPHQSRNAALKYNAQVHSRAAALGAIVIDWFNMTLDAPSADGYHFLTEVNVLKAAHFMRLGELAIKEGNFYKKKNSTL